MSNYYLSAYTYNSKKMKIPIESKHVYDNKELTDNSLVPQYGVSGVSGSQLGLGRRVKMENIILLWDSNSLRLKPGVNADGGLIGDKIMLKSVYQEYIHSLTVNAYYAKPGDVSDEGLTTVNPYVWDTVPDKHIEYFNNPAWRRDFRFMIVHFDDEDDLRDPQSHVMNATTIRTGIARWFNTIYVPNIYSDSSQLTTPQDGYAVDMSNKSELMRESTKFNNTYKIYRNEKYTLTPTHNYQVFKVQLDPHKTLNFKPAEGEAADSWAPTDDWYSKTYAFIITPSNYALDMDPISASRFNATVPDLQAAKLESHLNWKIKYTYYDL